MSFPFPKQIKINIKLQMPRIKFVFKFNSRFIKVFTNAIFYIPSLIFSKLIAHIPQVWGNISSPISVKSPHTSEISFITFYPK